MTENIPFKSCTKCGLEFPRSPGFFHRDSTKPDGFHPRCKTCRKANSQSYYRNNKDEILERNRQWRKDNPEKSRAIDDRFRRNNPEKVKAVRDRSYRKHRAKRNAESLRYRHENIERLREYDRKYAKENRKRKRNNLRRLRARKPELFRAYCSKYRAQKQNGEGVTERDIQDQYANQRGLCCWCSEPTNGVYHVDHIVPLSRGGPHQSDNIVIACPSCNTSKGNSLVHDEWIPPNPL